MNMLLEPGFLSNPTALQKLRFESNLGRQVLLDGIRSSGMWRRRMSQLAVFWGETDSNGAYVIREYGDSAAVKRAVDAWLAERGLAPCAR